MSAAPGPVSAPTASRRQRLPFLVPAAWPAALLIGGAVVLPFLVFVVYGFWTQEIFSLEKTFTLDQYSTVLSEPLYRELLGRTLLLGFIVASVAVPIAYLAAYAVCFKLDRFRGLVLFAVVLSMLGSYLTKILSWKVLLAPAGLISNGLETLGITSGRIEGLSTGWFPIIVALVHLLLPLAFLAIYASMQSIDRDVPKAARDLGASPWLVSTRVILPLARRGVATAFALVFVLACGDYVTPQLFSGGGGTMIGAVIYQQFGITRDWPLASALAVTLILAIAASLLLAWFGSRVISNLTGRRARRSGNWPSLSMPIPRIGRHRIGWGGPFSVLLLCFLYLPLLVVVLFSFADREIIALPIEGLTTDWYSQVLRGGPFSNALGNSLRISALTVLFCLAAGVPLAFAFSRRRFRLKRPLEVAVALPLVIPGIIIGFALLAACTELGLEPGILSAAIGQTALLMPLSVFIMVARLEAFDRELESAARDLGCTPLGTLRRVTLPLVMPTMIATAIIVFALSLDEFVVTLYTSGSSPTVPILMWSILQRRGITPAVDAIATLLIVGTTLILLIGFFALRSRGGAAAAIRRGLSR